MATNGFGKRRVFAHKKNFDSMKGKLVVIWGLATLIFGNVTLAQKQAYQIEVKVHNFQGEAAYLGYPYGDKKYLADTAEVSNDGSFVFEGTKPLDGGLYFVYSPAPHSLYFDLIVAETHFSIETDTIDLIANMNPTGSPENEAFFGFQRFMRKMQKEGEKLSGQLDETEDEGEKEKLKAQLKALDEEVQAYRKKLIEDSGDLFAAKFIKSTVPVEVPESPKDADGNAIDENFGYYYYKQHFFDHVDFSDNRILRTPLFYSKVIEYLDKMTMKHPDSISASAQDIIENARANKEVFRYCVQTLTHKYETSNIMGMDAVFVDLAERYYLSGDAYWADDETIEKIEDRVARLKPNLIGKHAPALLLLDTLERPVNALAIKSDYMVLYFYDPDCGHCRKKTPVLRDLYHEKLKEMGVVVVAANVKKDLDEWKEYIRKQELDVLNLADPHTRSNFRYEYNIETTPQVYILDDQKKILAKKLDVEQIEDFIERQNELKAAQ
jgi:peroxiredoxin